MKEYIYVLQVGTVIDCYATSDNDEANQVVLLKDRDSVIKFLERTDKAEGFAQVDYEPLRRAMLKKLSEQNIFGPSTVEIKNGNRTDFIAVTSQEVM